MLRHTYLLIATLIFGLALPTALHAQGVPTSVALLYFEEKNFEVGDWVLYEVIGVDYFGDESIDYQKVQVVAEMEFRGEDCFWLETGWGKERDSLNYSAVLVSEGIYQEDNPVVKHSLWVRKMHIGEDDDGNPIAMEVRLSNPGKKLPDLEEYRPVVRDLGVDTLVVGGREWICNVVEEIQERKRLRDMADSTSQSVQRSVRKRWLNPEIPITGLVKEVERRERLVHTWPLGRPSTDFPTVVREAFDIEVTYVDMGDGAKPKVADRIKDASNPFQSR